MSAGIIKTFLSGLTHKDKIVLVTSVGSFFIAIALIFVQSNERKTWFRSNERVTTEFSDTTKLFVEATLMSSRGTYTTSPRQSVVSASSSHATD
jgi:hypothetical protein|tara:strand:- start:4197 stop:4478 length:282 start_codon:yes stop_codon:yes gene_type:complete